MDDGSRNDVGQMRELRQRKAQAPYRPRPQLTSSNRGKAGAELRRQKEVEANQVFAEANDYISHVKITSGSSNAALSDVGDGVELSIDEHPYHNGSGNLKESLEEHLKDTASNNGQGVIDKENSRDSEEIQDEKDVTRILGGSNSPLPAITTITSIEAQQSPLQINAPSCKESLRCTSDWIEANQNADAFDLIDNFEEEMPGLEKEQNSQAYRQGQSSPLAKRARYEDDEFLEDDDFFENLVAADEIDWDQPSKQIASSSKLSSSPVLKEVAEEEQYVIKNRQQYPATNGFKWSSERKVELKEKSIEEGSRLLESVMNEKASVEALLARPIPSSQRSTPQDMPAVTPSNFKRPALGDVTSSMLNSRQGIAKLPLSSRVAEGKRKAIDPLEQIDVPSTPFRPASTLLSTPNTNLKDTSDFSPSKFTPLIRRTRLGASRPRTLLDSPATAVATNSPAINTATPSRPSLPPRISLGMTPKRLHSGNISTFKTPFKDPSRVVAASPHHQQTTDRKLLATRGISAPSVMKVGATIDNKVFDLSKDGLERTDLESVFVPESTSLPDTSRELNVNDGDSIKQILKDPAKGKYYAFEVGEQLCGVGSARLMLQDASNSSIEIARSWVENHYIEIILKLAAYTRHVLHYQYWNYEEVCRQLKYRYEREVNQKQRSAVMQIMKRGQVPNRGMVLYVFAIPEYNIEKDADQIIILSDGWYRIKAKLDKVLTLAVYGRDTDEEFQTAQRNKRERESQTEAERLAKEKAGVVVMDGETILKHRIVIKVGSKLCIQGCQFESEWESVDPLKGFEKSRLLIGGNSTKLARWDSRLGSVRACFFSTIRSLSPKGGDIALMDLIVTRMYPIAYTGIEVCPGYTMEVSKGTANEKPSERSIEPIQEWSFQEEEERRAHWEAHYDRSRKAIVKELEEDVACYKRIYRQLDGACEGLSDPSYDDGSGSMVDASTCDEMFQAILAAGDARSYLRLDNLLPTLRDLAGQRLEIEMGIIKAKIISTLDARIGKRRVKSFRDIRARDATHEDYGREIDLSIKRLGCKRTALIRIYNYVERGEEGFHIPKEVGDHLLVSNLTPKELSRWPKMDDPGDVQLTSGQESRWERVKRG